MDVRFIFLVRTTIYTPMMCAPSLFASVTIISNNMTPAWVWHEYLVRTKTTAPPTLVDVQIQNVSGRPSRPRMERLNLQTKAWRVQELSIGRVWNPSPNQAQSAIDPQGEAVYWVDAWGVQTPSLARISLNDGLGSHCPAVGAD